MLLTGSPLSASNTEKWDSLQRPRASTGADTQLLLLMSALDAGWHVEQPVYLRTMMGERSHRAYHVIVHRPGHSVNLFTLPQNREADDLAQREGWQILATGY